MDAPAQTSASIREHDITFNATDGFPLSGKLLVPERPTAAVLFSPATGMPKEFRLDGHIPGLGGPVQGAPR